MHVGIVGGRVFGAGGDALTPDPGLAITTLPTPSAATNGGYYFLPLTATAGTPPYTFAFNYAITATVTGVTNAANAVITINTVSATHPFTGLSIVYFSAVGGMTDILFDTVRIITLAGSSGAWTLTTSRNTSTLNTWSGTGTILGGANTGSNAYQLWQNTLFGGPTINETALINVTCTDSATPTPKTVFQTLSLTTNSSHAIMGVDQSATSTPLPVATNGNKYRHTMISAAGTGSGKTWSVSAGTAPPGLTLGSSTGTWTGTPTAVGNYAFTVQCIDSGPNTATAAFTMSVIASGNVARPGYNSSTSNGFFVLNGNIYDTNGAGPFIMRGINQDHYDQGSGAAYNLTQANAVRFGLYNGQTDAAQESVANSMHVANGRCVIVARFGNTTTPPAQTGNSSGSTSQALLGAMTADWCKQFSVWSPIQTSIMVNVANEWGPTNSTNWRDAYVGVSGAVSSASGTTITISTVSGTNPFAGGPVGLTYAYFAGGGLNQVVAISATGGVSGAWTITTSTSLAGYTSGGTLWGGAVGMLRGAGYTCPIVIDTGNFGEDINDFVNYSNAVFQSDALLNCVFSFHMYGLGQSFPPGATPAQLASIITNLQTLQSAHGMAFIFGEFGASSPPLNTSQNPTPSLVSAEQIIVACEGAAFGWFYWAFDDGHLASATAYHNDFGATLSNGVYTNTSSLTWTGMSPILHPRTGMTALATPAPEFL